MNSIKPLKLPALLLFVATSAFAAGEDVKTVEATGEAAIVSNDLVRARAEARKAALRNAVEQVAGVMITAHTLTANNQLVSDRIFANAQGYAKPVGEPKFTQEGGVVTCSLTAAVSAGAIDKDLAAIQALVNALEAKKMIVLMQEQVIDLNGGVSQTGVMTDIISRQLKTDGWTLIDPAFAHGKLKLNAAAGLSASEAKEIGNLTKTDYILYGTSVFRQQSLSSNAGSMMKGTPIFLATGEYNITIFATDTGTQLGTVAGKISYDSKNPEKARKIQALISYERTTFDLVRAEQAEILGEVRSILYKDLGNASSSGSRLVVDVKGLADYGAAEDFKKVLEERRGVQAVDVSFADGKANYDVTFVGSSGDLAAQFRGPAKDKPVTFQGKKIQVTAKTANRVELTVK